MPKTLDLLESLAPGKIMLTDEKIPLPLTFEEISSEWLTQALSQRYPGVEVTSFAIDSGMHTTSSKARLHLQYNDAGQRAGLPPQMYIKGGFDPRVLKRIWGGLAIEVRFFTEIAPELKINIPRCYFAQFDEKSRQGIVLLEDLTARGATFGAPNRPVTPDRVAAMLELTHGGVSRPLVERPAAWELHRPERTFARLHEMAVASQLVESGDGHVGGCLHACRNARRGSGRASRRQVVGTERQPAAELRSRRPASRQQLLRNRFRTRHTRLAMQHAWQMGARCLLLHDLRTLHRRP